MNDSLFDPRRESDAPDEALIADFERRLAPLRFDSRPLDFDRFVHDEHDESHIAHTAATTSSSARRGFLAFTPAARWMVAASLVIVVALSLWSMREQRPAIAAKTQIPHTVTPPQMTGELVRGEPLETVNPQPRDEQPYRVVIAAPDASPINPVRHHADKAPRRASQASRASQAKGSDRTTNPRRDGNITPPDPSAAATGDLLLAIRVTGDKLDHTGRQLAARLAAASFVPDSKFLRSLNPNETVPQENRP